MNLPTAHPNTLARRLTTAAVGLQLLGAILVQLYLISAGPLAALTREAFARPDMVASTVVNIVAGCILVGLTTWAPRSAGCAGTTRAASTARAGWWPCCWRSRWCCSC